jgi:S-adenosylmethionine decarboxylase
MDEGERRGEEEERRVVRLKKSAKEQTVVVEDLVTDVILVPSYGTFGRHVIAELKEAQPGILNDAQLVANALIDASVEAGATVMAHEVVEFQPQGCSVVVVLSESHVTIHTFPEHRYASFDAYTCGEKADPHAILQGVIDRLKIPSVELYTIHRGQLDKGMMIV